MRHRLFFILLGLSLLIVPISAQESVAVILDIGYGDETNPKQALDLYLPTTGTAPYPTIFMVHGGGFFAGDKEEMATVARYYANLGYAVIAPNYRLAPEVTFPDGHADAFCAMAWTFSHADQYGLDTDNLYLFGESAGGNVVAYVATIEDTAPFLSNCDFAYPDEPQFTAVISLYAPVDLLTCDCMMARRMASYYTGISYFAWQDDTRIQQYRDISFTAELDADDPPFYIIHGDEDTLVPLSESQWFVETYQALGGYAELVVFEGANHGFLTGYPSPYEDQSYRVIDAWLR